MSSGVLPPGAEMLLMLIGTRERRAACHEPIKQCASNADYVALAGELTRQKLLPLVGTRLEEIAGDVLPAWFRAAVASSVQGSRIRGAMLQHVTEGLVGRLREGGVELTVLKGPLLAARLYGDAGLRPSNDVDLLVRPEQFNRAVELLEREGYTRPRSSAWVDGLPLFETSLVPRQRWLPPIDLHWRVHWYDRAFSADLIERSQATLGEPVPQPVDELAMLLLMFARDGFAGARSAADVAAWWDANQSDVDTPLLDHVASAHPRLRNAIEAAAAVSERLVGVPASQLVGSPRATRAPSFAARLQNWRLAGGDHERHAASTLVDWLLRPPGGGHEFIRRHMFIPQAAVMEAYDARDTSALVRRLLWLRYGLVMLAQVLPRWVVLHWRVRGGRELVAIPDRLVADGPRRATGPHKFDVDGRVSVPVDASGITRRPSH